MEAVMDLFEAGFGHVGIDLGRADAGMAQKLLDDSQVGAMLQEMRGKTMPQAVRSDTLGQAGSLDAVLNPQPERDRSELGAAAGQEEIARGFRLG